MEPKELYAKWLDFCRDCDRFRDRHGGKGYLELRDNPGSVALNKSRYSLVKMAMNMPNPDGELTGVCVFTQKYWAILWIIPRKWPPA